MLQDPEGDLGIELGVYGAPETFLDESGRVLQEVGAITRGMESSDAAFVDDIYHISSVFRSFQWMIFFVPLCLSVSTLRQRVR